MRRNYGSNAAALGRNRHQAIQVILEGIPVPVQVAGPQHGSNTESADSLRDPVFAPVHVHEKGRAAQQHLDNAQLGT